MKRRLGSAALGLLILFGAARGGEDKKDDKNLVRFTATAEEVAREFALGTDKAIKKYQPVKPFQASVDLRGVVAKVNDKNIYLAADADVVLMLRAKTLAGKVDGPTAVRAKDSRFVEFRANTIIMECAEATLTPIPAK